MRPLHSLLVLLFLIAAGVGAWFFLRGFEEPPGYGAAATPAEMPAEAPSETPVALVRPENASAGENGAERVLLERAPEPESQGASRAVRSEVAVRGRVVDFAGKPVSGARVLAAASSGLEGPSLPLDLRGIERMPWLRRSEAKTDGDGRFELRGLRPGAMRLAVRASGFAPHDDPSLSLPAGESHELEPIVLDASVFVSGRVIDARGRGVASAEILRVVEGAGTGMLFGAGRGRPAVPVATTLTDGSFLVDQLASGPFTLRVVTEDHPDQTVSGLTRRPGESVQGLSIVLDDGFEIAGRVLGAPASVLPTLSIRAVPSMGDGAMGNGAMGNGASGEGDDDSWGGPARLAGTGEVREARAAPDGSFVVRGLREGKSYALSARRVVEGSGFPGDLFSPALSPAVVARAGDRGVELAYQPEAALVFQVIDARTRAPLTELEVEAGIDWPLPLMDEAGSAIRHHPEGRVRFGNLRPKAASDRAELVVRAAGYGEWKRDDIALQAGADLDLGVIELEPVPLTRVRVLDLATGAPVAEARVILRQMREEEGLQLGFRSISVDVDSGEDGFFDDGETHSARTDEQGLALVTSFEGERCTLEVRHDAHAPHESQPFVCDAGAQDEHVVRLSFGGTVRVHLTAADESPVAGARVEHQAPGDEEGFEFLPGDGGRNVTDAAGLVVFQHLAPGVHRFRPQGGGPGFFESDGGDSFSIQMRGLEGEDPAAQGWTEALVTEGGVSEITVVAPVRVDLSGRVREAGEDLAGATVSLAPKSDGPRARMMPFLGANGPRAQTDGRGEYRLEDVKCGEYVLSIAHPSRAMPSEFELTLGEEDEEFDVDLDVAVIEGRVSDERGEPLSGVRVWPEQARPEGAPRGEVVRVMAFAGHDGGENVVSFGPGGFSRTQATTDGEGRYSLRGVQTGVDLVVRGEAKDLQPGQSKSVRVEAGDTRTGVDLELAAAGRIDVIAVRADGTAGRNLLVVATQEGASGDGERKTAFIQENGRTSLDGLAPGSWRVSLRVLGPRDDAPSIPEQTVEVDAGKTASANFRVP